MVLIYILQTVANFFTGVYVEVYPSREAYSRTCVKNIQYIREYDQSYYSLEIVGDGNEKATKDLKMKNNYLELWGMKEIFYTFYTRAEYFISRFYGNLLFFQKNDSNIGQEEEEEEVKYSCPVEGLGGLRFLFEPYFLLQRMCWMLGENLGDIMSQDTPRVVPANITTAIKPKMVFANRQGPAMLAMIDTLDKCEFEAVGAWIVIASQDVGDWIAFVRPDKGEYDNMIEAGFLMETQVENGWRYELTLLAIEQIYIRQTDAKIRYLESSMRWSHGISFWHQLKKLFTPAPALS